jgi:aromatic-L-amino-acid decarboxylase
MMDWEQFSREGHALVDWMTDYLRHVGRERVVPMVAPGQIRAALPSSPPEAPEPFDQIRADFDRVIYPGLTHWAHPGFFGFFPANHSPPSILAEMLTAALGAQAMSWQTSPAATELEQVVMDWLRQMIGLPPSFTGVIQDYASTSTLVSLITARERVRDRLDRAVVYLSSEAHSSVTKGIRLAGFRPELVHVVPVDERYALRPEALAAMIAADRAAGLLPAAVVATVGTTSSTALDPLGPIGVIAQREGLWFHVDAAFGGSAAILPELRWIFDGIEAADSVVMNPHKWLLVNFDCSAYFVRDPAALLRTFSTSPAYLQSKHDSQVVNYRDWGIPLGRRFRALKLWFVIRSYGVTGLQAMVREHVRLGHLFARWVEEDPDFELMAPAPIGLVCFRWRPRGITMTDAEIDRANHEVLDRINARGDFFLIHTVLGGRVVLRLALGHLSTTEEVVRQVWEAAKASGRGQGTGYRVQGTGYRVS